MTGKQKAVAWGMGILVWTNVLSILLSAWQFGSVDWGTVAHMGMIALPPLAVGTFLLYRLRAVTAGGGWVETRSAVRVSGTGAPVRAER